MLKIGLRNIKTAISVFICLIVYFIIVVACHIFKQDWASNFKIATQLYTPFFACLATAYSISTDRAKSLAQASLRLSASVIGGIFGMIVVALYQLTGRDWPFQHISATGNPTTDKTGLFETGFLGGNDFTSADVTTSFIMSFIVPILLTALAVIIVIWFCNLIKKPQCSFIAVLTLCAVMTSLGTNPVIYGPNRIISTVVGILVALGVNLFHLPHYKNKNKIFIFGIDGMYSKDSEKFNGYNHYMMHKLIHEGADVSMFTTRTPGSLKPMLGEAMPTTPVICMSGAAVYDFKESKYLYTKNIPSDISLKMADIFEEMKVSPFVSVVKDDLLYTYSEALDNKGEILYAKNRKNAPYVSLNLIDKAPKTDVLYYVIIDTNDRIQEIKDELKKKEIADDLLMLTYDVYEPSLDETGYSYLKIYSKEITKLPFIQEKLKQEGKEIYGIGVHQYDFILTENVDKVITTDTASDNIKAQAQVILSDPKKEHSILIKHAMKLYHTKDKA